MRLLFVVLFAAVTAHALKLKWSPSRAEVTENNFDYDFEEEWQHFKETHERVFHSCNHELKRRAIFENNLKMIAKHNNDYSKGLTTFKMGVNQFADMTTEEFSKIMSVPNNLKETQESHKNVLKSLNLNNLPEKIDWRDEGCITEVKNQRSNSASYAFSAVGVLEAHQCKKTGKLVALSEQNVVDCDSAHSYSGRVTEAYDYIKANGIDTQASYLYWDDCSTCKFKNETVGARIEDYVSLTDITETNLKAAVALVGPVSVRIFGSSRKFKMYKEGVLDDPDCDDLKYSAFGHYVVLVGYGTEDGQDYWLVKNSWGEYWGDKGYIKISRNKDMQCGIADKVAWPIL